MKIKWLGHSCFVLEESTGTTVVTDPYSCDVGHQMPLVQADAVTVSHQHKDHSFISAIQGNPEIISTVGAFEVDGIHIYSVASYHDNNQGKDRGSNLIFKYRLDGVEVCHLGDIGQECNARILDAIGSTNVLIIPVGGKYTIDAETAKDYVDKIMPDIVIPMHYKTDDCVYNIDYVDDFLDYFDEECIHNIENDEIEFDRTQFDGDFETKIIVFKSRN
ncbi:MAG: MBL fold metallo-hydrolase [Clostridia bacterium]|nr:MBL fold metallo-hydrolase [Clostridia bacterium]